MFTSCCPGWVRFLKSQYPDMVDQLSSAKSPQQMFGAVAKSYYAELMGVDPSSIFSVSIMPCLAKKQECAYPTMNDAGAGQDVDVVLTTREVDRLFRAEQILPELLPEEEFDQPLGTASGARDLRRNGRCDGGGSAHSLLAGYRKESGSRCVCCSEGNGRMERGVL